MAHKLGWLVEDYGAAGDGSTNDQPAFAGLVTGMKTRTTAHGQQHVGLGPKVYSVNSPIVIDGSGLQLHGHNRLESVIEASASFPANEPIIDVVADSGNTQLSDVQVGNVTLRRTTANGPLIRLRGVRAAMVSNCVLGACDTYVEIDQPGTAENLQVTLSGLDCIGSPAIGVTASDVDVLCVVDSKLKCAGAGANGISITTGDACAAINVLFEDCGNAPIHLRTTATNFVFSACGREGSITRWVDDDATCTGVSFGREWTTNTPAGTWVLYGPLDNA